jgi:hypothetical protein
LCIIPGLFVCLFLARQPPVGQSLLINEASRSHTTTHHSRKDSSGRVISSSQRPLPDNTHNTHNRQTSIPPVGCETTVSAGERPQTYVLDRAATAIGIILGSTYTTNITCFQGKICACVPQEGIWKSGGATQLIFNLGTRWR